MDELTIARLKKNLIVALISPHRALRPIICHVYTTVSAHFFVPSLCSVLLFTASIFYFYFRLIFLLPPKFLLRLLVGLSCSSKSHAAAANSPHPIFSKTKIAVCKMKEITNIYAIAALSVIGGGLFGFDISSMSAM